MLEVIRRTHRWVLALVVLAALTFSARSLMATPTSFCGNGGTCVDQPQCELSCAFLYPGGYDQARCTESHCCLCLL
jgi:hypothetical protein